jgi:hypothetical protein
MLMPGYVNAYAAGVKALQLDHKMYWRLHVALYFATRSLALDGDFVECGVWKGFLSAAIAHYTNWDKVNKTFYLFDTFDGLAQNHMSDAEAGNLDKISHLNSYFRNSYELTHS